MLLSRGYIELYEKGFEGDYSLRILVKRHGVRHQNKAHACAGRFQLQLHEDGQ